MIKTVSHDLYENSEPEHFVCGMIDFALEVKFLSTLQHPHIVQMWGTSTGSPFEKEYFVLLDKLEYTLEERMNTIWKEEKIALTTRKGQTEHHQNNLTLMMEKLQVCHDLCSALGYIHENK